MNQEKQNQETYKTYIVVKQYISLNQTEKHFKTLEKAKKYYDKCIEDEDVFLNITLITRTHTGEPKKSFLDMLLEDDPIEKEKEEVEVIDEVDVPLKKVRGRPRKLEGNHSKDREQVKEYNKQYYEKNREKLVSDMKTLVLCPLCKNCTVTKTNLLLHQKTSKCKMHNYENNCEHIDKLVKTLYKTKKKYNEMDVKDPKLLDKMKTTYNELIKKV